MKLFVLCLLVVSQTLAAPGTRKRDIDIYTYQYLPAVRQETTTHYCPEEDIPAVFVPSPPHIQSFPLPSLPSHPVIKYEAPIPLPIHHDHIPPPQFHHEYVPQAPLRQTYNEPAEPIAPHDDYGLPQAPHDNYGPPAPKLKFPGLKQEISTLPPPVETTETTTLPPPPPETTTEVITFPPQTEPPTTTTTILPPPPEITTEEITTTTHQSKLEKLKLLKQHFKQHLLNNIKLPEIQYGNPWFSISKKIEFPFLKNWSGDQH